MILQNFINLPETNLKFKFEPLKIVKPFVSRISRCKMRLIIFLLNLYSFKLNLLYIETLCNRRENACRLYLSLIFYSGKIYAQRRGNLFIIIHSSITNTKNSYGQNKLIANWLNVFNEVYSLYDFYCSNRHTFERMVQ